MDYANPTPPPYGAPPYPQPGFNVQPNVHPGYVNPVVPQPLNTSPYGYQPVIQPPITVLNATPRTTYWPGRQYGPHNRRTTYIALGIFSVFVLVSVIIFLTVFFTIMKKHDDFVQDSYRRHEEFPSSFFNH